MNVWKIGSRWGNAGTSVLDLFLNYECVFFGNCDGGERLGDWESADVGDFFVICDGETAVALGKSFGRFSEYRKSGFHFTDRDYANFIDDDVRICPANIVILPPEERVGNASRLRFCQYRNQEFVEKLPRLWETLSSQGNFKIIPRTVSLSAGDECIFASNVRYRIPIYQRPYSWGENELRKLIESLHEAVRTGEPVFMGTMQLSQPIPLNPSGTVKAYNIIDGQQRITTFLILSNVVERSLGKNVTPYAEEKLRTLVSRGEEQIKLDEYSAFIKNPNTGDGSDRNPYIRNYRIIETLLEEYFAPGETEEKNPTEENLYSFLKSPQIQFVVIETHAGLSKTLQIFNTINTAGLDLGATDLFKIRFYEYLKNKGNPDSVFDQISDVYASVEEYNRTNTESPEALSMQDILRTYQRVIFARNNLPQSVFNKSYETFFEELFDTLLSVRTHDEFKNLSLQNVQLSIDDLKKIIACYKENFALLTKDWHFRIISRMFWETRYGYTWDLPIIARFFECIQAKQVPEFTLRLFKLLCPPSLYFAKTVYAVRSAVIEALKALREENMDGIELLKSCAARWQFNGISLETMLRSSCEYEIAFNPKWKNLICRLVEYLKSNDKDKALFERLWSSIDIEHIQCFTDEKDAEKIREEWGAELNDMGNLVLLESSINRSINNHAERKPAAYRESAFASVKELADCVGNWTKDAAKARRDKNTEMLVHFILD